MTALTGDSVAEPLYQALRVICLRSRLSYSFPACPVEELGVRASNFRKAHLASKALGRTYTSKIPGTVRNGGP